MGQEMRKYQYLLNRNLHAESSNCKSITVCALFHSSLFVSLVYYIGVLHTSLGF